MGDEHVTIRRTASAGMHGEINVGPTKGRRVRAVPPAAPLEPIVREAAAGKGIHTLLFPSPHGGTVNPKNLSRALNRKAVRLSIKTFRRMKCPCTGMTCATRLPSCSFARGNRSKRLRRGHLEKSLSRG